MKTTATVTVNGESHVLDPGDTLADIVGKVTDRASGVAVALNAEVVPRGEWPDTRPTAGDSIEILTAVQGG